MSHEFRLDHLEAAGLRDLVPDEPETLVEAI